jgi:hypothetical protein
MGRQQHQSWRCRRGRQRCRRDGGAWPRDKSISMMHVFSLALSNSRPLAPPSSPASDQGSSATSQAGCETASLAARHANRRLLSLRPPRWSPPWMLVMTPPRYARTGRSTSTSWCHSKMPTTYGWSCGSERFGSMNRNTEYQRRKDKAVSLWILFLPNSGLTCHTILYVIRIALDGWWFLQWSED